MKLDEEVLATGGRLLQIRYAIYGVCKVFGHDAGVLAGWTNQGSNPLPSFLAVALQAANGRGSLSLASGNMLVIN